MVIVEGNQGGEALSYDDVLLKPEYSSVIPAKVETKTKISGKIDLNIPFVSAAMGSVTNASTGIAMAQTGGMGFIPKSMSLERQAEEVEQVKKYESGMVINPHTCSPSHVVKDVLDIMFGGPQRKDKLYSGVPVVDKNNKVVGIVTNRDIRFEQDLEKPVSMVMTRENLVKVKEGISREKAIKLLNQYKIEKLLVVDGNDGLRGLITVRDIEKTHRYPNACKDESGRLRVGAAVGVDSDRIKRAGLLIEAGVDILEIDSAHAHSGNVMETFSALTKEFPDMEVIVGNIATAKAMLDMLDMGARSIKIGIGPGSICTTRVVVGVGVPQFSAVMNCYNAYENSEHFRKGGKAYLIADGGYKETGQGPKAVGAGASVIMVGGYLAGCVETPGEVVYYQGRKYKIYMGEGSLEAQMKNGGDRYFNLSGDLSQLIAQGVVGRVPMTDKVEVVLKEMVGGYRAGAGYVGCKELHRLCGNGNFLKISAAALKEGHPNVEIIREPPNYRVG